MKTNHRRSFKDGGYAARPGGGIRITDNGKIVCAWGGDYHDYCRGKRGQRRDKRGAKKFINSRLRFHNKAALLDAVK